jgi:hypothetical protein
LFLKIFIFHRLQQCFGFDLFCVLVCCSSFPAEIFAASKISFSLLGLADAGGVLHESCAPSRRPVLSLFLRCLSISAANPAARVCLQFSIFPAGRWTLVCLPVFPLPLVESTAAKRQDQFFGPLRFGPCPGFNFTAGVQIRFEPQPCSSLPHDYRRFESLPSVFVLPVSPIRIRFVATRLCEEVDLVLEFF